MRGGEQFVYQRIAVSVGEPLDPMRYAAMKRDAMIDDLHAALKARHAAAERLRRK